MASSADGGVMKLLCLLLFISTPALAYMHAAYEYDLDEDIEEQALDDFAQDNSQAELQGIPGLDDRPCSGARSDIPDPNRILPKHLVNTALHMARLSNDAYKSCNTLKNGKLNGPFTLRECIEIKKTSTEGFIATGPGSIVIAFRGTQETKDFFTDLKFKATYFDTGRFCWWGNRPCVHKGFWNAYNSFYADYFDEIKEHIRPGTKIYVTGHSLGGAIATLFAYKLASDLQQYKSQIHLYAFGIPPVGNSRFTNGLKDLSLGSSNIVTIVGDAISYKKCAIGSVLGFLSKFFNTYRKPETVYYLPERGGHSLATYIEQLEELSKGY